MYVMNRSSSVAFDPIPSDLRDLVYELWDRHASAQFPLAYLITFTCYETRLHRDPRGSVDDEHNVWGSPPLPPCYNRVQAHLGRLRHAPYLLDKPRRRIVLGAIKEVCRFRKWILLAAHVRTTHAHAVVHAY